MTLHDTYSTVKQNIFFCHKGIQKQFNIIEKKYYYTLTEQEKQLYNFYFNQRFLFAQNIFVVHKNVFFEYMKELQFLIDVVKQNIDINNKSRYYGFCLQRFTGFILFKQQLKNKNYKYIYILQFDFVTIVIFINLIFFYLYKIVDKNLRSYIHGRFKFNCIKFYIWYCYCTER